jgi:hypothetical protein
MVLFGWDFQSKYRLRFTNQIPVVMGRVRLLFTSLQSRPEKVEVDDGAFQLAFVLVVAELLLLRLLLLLLLKLCSCIACRYGHLTTPSALAIIE